MLCYATPAPCHPATPALDLEHKTSSRRLKSRRRGGYVLEYFGMGRVFALLAYMFDVVKFFCVFFAFFDLLKISVVFEAFSFLGGIF